MRQGVCASLIFCFAIVFRLRLSQSEMNGFYEVLKRAPRHCERCARCCTSAFAGAAVLGAAGTGKRVAGPAATAAAVAISDIANVPSFAFFMSRRKKTPDDSTLTSWDSTTPRSAGRCVPETDRGGPFGEHDQAALG
jgi:hypothetical protein